VPHLPTHARHRGDERQQGFALSALPSPEGRSVRGGVPAAGACCRSPRTHAGRPSGGAGSRSRSDPVGMTLGPPEPLKVSQRTWLDPAIVIQTEFSSSQPPPDWRGMAAADPSLRWSPRSSYSRPAPDKQPASQDSRQEGGTARHTGTRTVQPRAARHGTRAAAMPARHPETDYRADTEYEHRKTPDNHKHLSPCWGLSGGPRTSVR
jgi:hypothetical protein